MRTVAFATSRAAWRALAALAQHLDSRDIIGVAGMVALGTGVGMVSVPAALIVVGTLLLLVVLVGSLR